MVGRLARGLLVPLAIVAAMALCAWWGLHLALSLDALAADRQFAPSSAVRRCGLDRESRFTSVYVERC